MASACKPTKRPQQWSARSSSFHSERHIVAFVTSATRRIASVETPHKNNFRPHAKTGVVPHAKTGAVPHSKTGVCNAGIPTLIFGCTI
jgi:hypothetical protein